MWKDAIFYQIEFKWLIRRQIRNNKAKNYPLSNLPQSLGKIKKILNFKDP